jgi:hypothetical protein
MPPWILPAIVGVLASAIIATSLAAVVQTRAADEARTERDALQAEVDELRDEIQQLEAELEDERAARPVARPDALGGLLDGLLGDGLPGDLGALLDGLLGSGGSLDPSSQPGAACFAPELGGMFGGSSAPRDLDELVTRTGDQVATLRELAWTEDVEVAFLDDAETRARLTELTELDDDGRERLVTEQLLLHALGATPADLDLIHVQQELLGDAVAGFYVSETQEVVVRVPASGVPGTADRITLAHELDHALVDQVLGLPDLAGAPFVDDRDAALAALSVIEGDATLLMTLWTLEHLSLTEQFGMVLDPAIAGQQAVLDAFPDVIGRELLFPYTAGLDWACDTFLEGGWAAVDAAYADPPGTTYEILYGEPTAASTPAALEAPTTGHRERQRTTFGAAELLWQLEAPGGDPAAALDRPDERVRAWAGGELVVWDGERGPAVGLSLRDRGSTHASLCSTMTAWAGAAFSGATTTRLDAALTTVDGPRSAAVACAGDEVTVGLAADVEVARSITGR